MKRTKTSFGYELQTDTCTIKVLTTIRSDEQKSSYIVECGERKLYPRSLKSARIITEDFNEYYKIYNRKKS